MRTPEKILLQKEQQKEWNKLYFDCPCGVKVKNGCRHTHKRSKAHLQKMEMIEEKKREKITLQKIYELLLKINNNILIMNT